MLLVMLVVWKGVKGINTFPIFWKGVNLLLPGLPDLSTMMSCGSLVSFFPCAKGIQSYRGDYFAIAKRCPGKSSPYSLLFLYCDEEGIGGLSSLLSDRLSLVSSFPLNYIEEENK